MAKITFQEVKDNIESQGWTLKSLEYHNLNEDLEIVCPEGHTIFKPYKNIRKELICPFCEQLKKDALQSVTKPRTEAYRILAIDQATLLSGWSLWDGQQLIAHGIFKSDSTASTVCRISQIRNWLINMVNNNCPDLVILEDIQLQDFHQKYNGNSKFDNVGITTFKVLSELLGVLQVTLEELKTPYKVAFAATWRAGVGVRGRARADKKKSAQLLVHRLYGLTVNEDEADAICIGKYASQTYGKEVPMISWN